MTARPPRPRPPHAVAPSILVGGTWSVVTHGPVYSKASMGSGSSSGSSGEEGGACGGASEEASAASIFAPGDVQRKCRRGHGARRSGLGTGTSIAGVALLQSEGAMGCTGAELSQGNTFFRVSSGYQRLSYGRY